MKKTLFALMLMAGSAFAQDPYPAGAAPGYAPSAGAYPAPGQYPYGLGAGMGTPGNYPPVAAYAAPATCGPGYMWIDGYYDANGFFVNGYCAVPPFSGAYWVAPGFFGGRFIGGYWGHGGIGYAPGSGFRGGYSSGSRFAGGYANGAHAPAAAPSFRSQGAAPGFRAPAAGANSFHSQGSSRGSGSAMHGGGSGHGGRR